MKNRILFWSLAALVAVSLILSAGISLKRIAVEKANSSVEIVMDWQDIKKLSLREGLPMDHLLKKLKAAGLTSVSLTEDTLETLELEGGLAWLTGYEQSTLYKVSRTPRSVKRLKDKYRRAVSPSAKSVLRASSPDPLQSFVILSDQKLASRVKEGLALVLGKGRTKAAGPGENGLWELEISDDEEELMTLGLGFSPQKFSYLINRGFFVIPRFRNNYRIDKAIAQKKLAAAAALGPYYTVVFEGDEVLGYKNNIRGVASVLKEAGINYGYIEMAEQKGDSALLKALQTGIVRVHSISEDEMAKKMTKPEAIARFDRAVSERGVRLLYIRPFYINDSGLSLADTNAAYISSLREVSIRAMNSPGQADSPSTLSVSNASVVILSLGICAGALFLLSGFVRVQPFFAVLCLVAAFLLPLVFDHLGHMLTFKKLAALACAVVFPSLAITSSFKRENSRTSVIPISGAIFLCLKSYGIALIGSLLIVGLLADTRFLIGSQQFIGIKFAFLAPLLVIGAYGVFFEENGAKSLARRLFDWLNTPLTMMNVVLALVIALAGAVYLLRSGNFAIGILESEKLARGLLENLMAVRPRTKEFLIGYPALFLGAAYYLKGARTWLWPLLLIATVGTVSTLNTFCHVHSPLLISLLRSAYGVILGIALGLIVYLLYLVFAKALGQKDTPLHS